MLKYKKLFCALAFGLTLTLSFAPIQVQAYTEDTAIEAQQQKKLYPSNLHFDDVNGKNINSGYLELEEGSEITLSYQISFYGEGNSDLLEVGFSGEQSLILDVTNLGDGTGTVTITVPNQQEEHIENIKFKVVGGATNYSQAISFGIVEDDSPDVVVDIPSVDLDPNTNTPAVDVNPDTNTPVVDVNPDTNTPIIDVNPDTNTPIIDVNPDTNTPIVDVNPDTNTPTVDVNPETNTPIVDVNPDTNTPIIDVNPETNTPVVDANPDINTPTVDMDIDTNMPMIDVHPYTNTPMVNLDPNVNTPTLGIQPRFVTPKHNITPTTNTPNIDTTTKESISDSEEHEIDDSVIASTNKYNGNQELGNDIKTSYLNNSFLPIFLIIALFSIGCVSVLKKVRSIKF